MTQILIPKFLLESLINRMSLALRKRLARSRCSVNPEWMNEWIHWNTNTSLVVSGTSTMKWDDNLVNVETYVICYSNCCIYTIWWWLQYILHIFKKVFYNNRLWKRSHFEEFHKFVLTRLWSISSTFLKLGYVKVLKLMKTSSAPNWKSSSMRNYDYSLCLGKGFWLQLAFVGFKLRRDESCHTEVYGHFGD